jgi:hypothetical protein
MTAVLTVHLALAHGSVVMAHRASGRRTEIAVMTGIVADRTADERAFQAAFGRSRYRG